MCGARPRQLRNSAPAPELPSMGQARLPPHRTGDSHSMAWLCSRRVRGQPRGPSCMCARASPLASKDERNPRLAQPPAGLRLQEQVHDAASDTDTWAQPPWLLPGMELRKTIICEALPTKKGLSRQKRGSRELSKATPPDKRGSHNKLTLETSNREISWAPGAGERKENKSAVRTDRQLPGWGSAYTPMCYLPFCPQSLCSSPGAKSGTKPFLQQRGDQECIHTGPEPVREKLGTCSSAQERQLLLPTSFSATTELRNPSSQ